MTPREQRRLAFTRRRVNRARRFAENTCPASRHLHVMADTLASGQPYAMFEDEPEHCAETMLSVLESLWKLRTKTGWPSSAERQRFEKAVWKTEAGL